MNKNVNFYEVFETAKYNRHRQEMNVSTNCPNCGKVLSNNNAQYGHFLSQGKQARAKYGNEIIDSKLNGTYVCSLKCNNAVQIDRQPELIKYMVNVIREDNLKYKKY